MSKKKKIAFIVNPVSGVGRKQYLRTYIDKYLDKNTYNYVVWNTEAPRHATELAREAVARGADVVVAVGGDGSVNEVADGLRGSSAALAILPLGSGNAFATHWEISRRLPEAFHIINAQHFTYSDIGMVNAQLFVATAGLGFAAYVACQIRGKKVRGFLQYMYQSIRAAFTYESKTYRFQLDESNVWLERKCYNFEVSNVQYYGYNVAIAPQADAEDGLLNVTLILDRPRMVYIANLWRIFTKKIHKANFVETYVAKQVTVVAPLHSPMHRDGEGEYTKNGVLRFGVNPKALKVIIK